MSSGTDFCPDARFVERFAESDAMPTAVAVVGSGRWGRILCRELSQLSDRLQTVHWVSERGHVAAQAWLDEYARNGGLRTAHKISIHDSLQSIVEDPDVRIAIVAKMSSAHYDAARALLEAGKHVLVEKPFVFRAEEANELVRLARENDRVLAVGYEFMYSPAIHALKAELGRLSSIGGVEFVWKDCAKAKWGVRKSPDLTMNIVTDLLPHCLSQLYALFGPLPISIDDVRSQDGSWQAELRSTFGEIPVSISLDKRATESDRRIAVTSEDGMKLELDFGEEPGTITLDGVAIEPKEAVAAARSLTAELAYFFGRVGKRVEDELPNSASGTIDVIRATETASAKLAVRQTEILRDWLWRAPSRELDANIRDILRHELLDPLLCVGLVQNPKDTEALDRFGAHASRIVHRFSRDPWATQRQLLEEEKLDRDAMVRLNAAIQSSDLLQSAMVREGVGSKYWSTVLPLIQSGSVPAVLSGSYGFPLRVGIYAAVNCMFFCGFCGRKHGVRYNGTDIEPGNDMFDQVFSEMPAGISTLSLGGGLEPLTNPKLDDVIRSAKKHGHRVPLVTNGYMLTPSFVERHEGLWDLDVFRISCYGVDEASYFGVTKRKGAFALVKENLIAFLTERNRRKSPLKVGLNFIVLMNGTDQVLRLLDLIRDINDRVDGPGVDFLTLREDFSVPETEGLTQEERQDLIDIFAQFKAKWHRECPDLQVDFGYALYPLTEGVMGNPLAMVAEDGMLPKVYPQVSVAIDLLGDVYLYRDAAFLDRPGADRYIAGRVSRSNPLEQVVREFIESGREIEPLAGDPALMDAFDHAVTKVILQGEEDEAVGIPFNAGPVAGRCYETLAGGQTVEAVNYWQKLFRM